MASLLVDVHPSEAKLAVFRDSNCFLITSMVSAYTRQLMLTRVMADGSTRSLCNALYDHRSSRLDIAFLGTCAKPHPNMW